MTWITWYNICLAENAREGSLLDFTADLIKSGQIFVLMYILYRQSPVSPIIWQFIAMWAFLQVWRWIMFWAGCVFYWQNIMKQFEKEDIKRASIAQWTILVLFSPLLDIAGNILFVIAPFLHSIAHASFIGDLTYVVAPKGDEVPSKEDKQVSKK